MKAMYKLEGDGVTCFTVLWHTIKAPNTPNLLAVAEQLSTVSNPCKTCRAIMRKCACTLGEITHKNSQIPAETRAYAQNYGHEPAIVTRKLRENLRRPP